MKARKSQVDEAILTRVYSVESAAENHAAELLRDAAAAADGDFVGRNSLVLLIPINHPSRSSINSS